MEKIYKACDENQELKENYFLKINKNVLKKVLKEINAIEKLFQYFISEQVDVENGKSAKLLYEELGWNQNVSYDVINSFWITFSYAMRLKYPGKYRIAKAGNVKIYKHHNTDWGYDSFPEKYFKENSEERGQVNDLCKEYPDILKLADMCHTVANFMPCPERFNSVKGLLGDVRDYLPLMIDKIQLCVDAGKDLEYYHLGSLQKVDNKIVKDWHSFFIKNQEKYCLSMYYQVKKNRISGITFFKGQSLSYPCPLEKEEVEECLKTMLDKINKRADLILNRYNEEHKSNS